MHTLLISIVTTVLAGLLIPLFSRQARAWLFRSATTVLGLGLDRVYRNQAEAEPDIVSATKEAEEVRILGMRGRSVVDGYLRFLIRERPFPKLCLLLADPDAPLDYNPVMIRAREIEHDDSDLSVNHYIDEGRDALRSLYRWNLNSSSALKVYQLPPIFRMISTESVMFLSFYPWGGRARENILFRFPSTSQFYRMFARYFDSVWSDARSHEPSKYSQRAQE